MQRLEKSYIEVVSVDRPITEYSRDLLKGADIIVFPEYGLTSTNVEGGDVLSLTQVVPHPADQVVLYLLNQTSNHTQVGSGGAAEGSVVMVVMG